jgi:hypothetical protein
VEDADGNINLVCKAVSQISWVFCLETSDSASGKFNVAKKDQNFNAIIA